MKKLVRRFLVVLGRLLGLKVNGPFRRYLTFSEAQSLAAKINMILGMQLQGDAILKTARIIRGIEARMIGRIAGDVDDHILNYYLIKHAANKLSEDIVFVEIGVLFGGSSLVMMQALKDSGIQRKILAIDPLDSYYGENEDPITLLPITRNNVLVNVSSANLSTKNFTLISTLSQLPQTVGSLRDVEIGVIYIDGDHSYEGVKRDWDNYSPLVVQGGYVLIDNYHDDYEGIDRFVDEEVIPYCMGWIVAGTVNRSIVLMKKE